VGFAGDLVEASAAEQVAVGAGIGPLTPLADTADPNGRTLELLAVAQLARYLNTGEDLPEAATVRWSHPHRWRPRVQRTRCRGWRGRAARPSCSTSTTRGSRQGGRQKQSSSA
jgi:hypothetical protein